MKKDIDKLTKNLEIPTITVIGQNSVAVPVYQIEAIIEYGSQASREISERGLEEGKLIKALLDEDKIKSLILLDNGDIIPSTFHYISLRNRCSEWLTFVTTVGGDNAGINIDKIHFLINYKYCDQAVVDEILERYHVVIGYDDIDKTRSMIVMQSCTVYPSTFNFSTLRRRLSSSKEDI